MTDHESYAISVLNLVISERDIYKDLLNYIFTTMKLKDNEPFIHTSIRKFFNKCENQFKKIS